MAAPEEGGAAANPTSSSYGGGAGGKFRKKPPRRQTTPYERPPTAIRGNSTNNSSNSSWLTKLVVEPASKLISYGADRFFGSVFRRRLPPPPPFQPPEANAGVSDVDQSAVIDDDRDDAQDPRVDNAQDPRGDNAQDPRGDNAQDPRGDDCREPVNRSSSNVVLELEQLLKQKTFSRSEIVQLTELLQSRAVGVSIENASQKNEEPASDFGRPQELASALFKGNRNDEGIRSTVVSTPVHSSKVLDDIASPAEVAKAYMGSRPSKVSPSELGVRSQLRREDAGLPNAMPFALRSPMTLMAKETSVSKGALENGFMTPRSRSRSAIYNMARTPYSRVHPTSILKGSGINNNGYTGPSTSSPLSLEGNNEKCEHQPVTLKRRSSVLDDEGGSVGPIRRIRQRSNLLGPRLHQHASGMGIGTNSKHNPELNGGHRSKALKNIVESENESVPSTSYSRVPPSRSSEVASKILSKLEEMTPKGKSSESKLVAARDKSSLRSSPNMPSGQSPRSTEDVGSSKLLLDARGDDKFGDRTNAKLPDAHNSSPQKQGKGGDSEPKTSVAPSVMWNPISNNNSTASLKASTSGIGASDSIFNNGASQPPQKKRAFRMSAQEDSMEQDDVQCNGLASKISYEKRAPTGSPPTDSNLAPAGGYKPVNFTIESKDKSPSGFTSSRTNEVSPGAFKIGEGASGSAVPLSEETKTTLQSEALPSSFIASDKPKLANNANNPPLFSFSSKVADKFPSAESSERAEPEVRKSNSSDNTSVSIGSEVKATESHVTFPKPGDVNGNSNDVSSSPSNGLLFSSSSAVSFPAVPSSDANQISTSSANLFTSTTSTTISNSTGASTSSSFTSSIFGLAGKPSGSQGEPIFKFGSSAELSTGNSPASTAKFELNASSGSSTSSASSGSGFFGLSSFANSTENNLQGSLFANASKPLVSDSGTVSQGTSSPLFSATPTPAFNANTGTSSGSSTAPTFSFSSPASSPGPTSLASFGGLTSSPFSFGTTSTTLSSSTSSPGVFSFGLNSSSSSTPTIGSTNAASPVFGFGGTSSVPGISFTSSASSTPSFIGSSSASFSSSSAPSTGFGSTLQGQKSPIFGSTFTPPSPSTGFSFGPSTSTFGSSTSAFGTSTSSPVFSFTSSSGSALSSPSLFGNPPIGGSFTASPGNNDQMNAEDSMAEDPAPSPAPGSIFGQPSVAPSPPGFGFGSTTAPSQVNPFVFGGQPSQAPPQNPSPFQASGSQEFSAGGSFSLGSSDKSGRKIVKVSRSRNRKK